MRILRLFLPGRYEDAQLYMGHLVAFTDERDARVVELQRLTTNLESKYPDWKGVLTFAFARNDWLTGGVMTALARNPAVAGAMNKTVRQVERADLTLSAGDVELLPLQGYTQEADVILDSVLYGSRLYLGTTSGLFDYDIDWQRLIVDASRRRLEARCVSANAEYGTVNASCEDEGLFTGYDEFGWRDHSNNGAPDMRQTADRSLRASWYGTDLVNYEGPTEVALLHGTVEEVSVDLGWIEGERKLVTRFSAPSDDLNDLVRELETQREVPMDDVQFVWNSSRAFFINTHEHGFFTAYRKVTPDTEEVRLTRHGATDGRVVAVHPFARGWVVETDFRAYVLTGGRLIELVDQEPLSVRTFEGSKRFRRLVAVTVETGIYLLSAIDEFKG